MTINFYLNFDNRNKSKEKGIYCYIRENKKTIVIHTGEHIDPKHWNIQKQIVKTSYVGSPELNECLQRFKEEILSKIRKLKIIDPFISFENIRLELNKQMKNNDVISFFETFELFIQTRKPQVSKATTTKFNTLKKQIHDFAEKQKLHVTFESIDLSFFDKLHNYFLSNGISNNTIHKNMQFIKSFLKWALEREYTRNNTFEKHHNNKLIDSDKIALTRIEVQKIQSCTNLNEKLQKVKDLFLFQLYTGQRFSDIAKFKIIDVKNGIWLLRQQKTQKQIEIPLIEPALEILSRYNNILPTISNQRLNDYLKELGKLAGIDDLITVTKFLGADKQELTMYKYQCITTHTARRTFVSLASYDGVNQQVVKSFTGHGTDKMVNKYFKSNTSDSKKVIENIFNN